MHSVQRSPTGRRLSRSSHRLKRAHRVGVFSAGTLVAAYIGAGPAGAATSVAGGAYGISANVNAVLAPVSVGALPTVSLPPDGGGPFAESLLSANLAGLAPVAMAKVSTEGNSGLGSAKSSARVIDAGIAGLVTLSAAQSQCSATSGGALASASVIGLVVAGIPISTVDAGPNTSIVLPVGRVVINEQRTTGSQVTVNAVHITLNALAVNGDIVIAQSRCAVRGATRGRSRYVRRVHRARHS